LLDVRLIKRVDAYDRAGHSRCKLPEIKLLPQVERVIKSPTHDRVAGGFERAKLVIRVAIRDANADVNEQAVVVVNGRHPERFTGDRNYPFAFLARALGNQLLDPQAKGGD